MKNIERETIKKWINTWDIANTALQKVKSSELGVEDYYQKNLGLLNAMLCYAVKHGAVRLSSGLIEQQQFFMKFYRQNQNISS